MKIRISRVVWLAALAGGATGMLSTSLQAQDSTSTTNGLPGDAVDAYRVGATQDQVNNYVLDLSGRTSSWGRGFAFGPLAKASRATAGGYFGHIIGGTTSSSRMAVRPFLRTSYASWQGPTFGINATTNAAPGSVDTSTLSGQQFGAAFMEFGGGNDAIFGTGDDENNIIGIIAAFEAATPNRLYISRINALSNRANGNFGTQATASLGVGGVDELGNIHIYADGYGMTSPLRLQDRALVRVASQSRAQTLVNRIEAGLLGNAGAASFVRTAQTTMAVPTIISGALPGGALRPIALTTDFASDFIFESTLNTTTATKAYLPGSAGSVRGSMSFIPQTFTPLTSTAGVGIGATLARTSSNTRTRAMQFWGITSSGAVVNQAQYEMPVIAGFMTDPTDGFAPGTAFPTLNVQEFTNYASQLPFRGGGGQVATVVLPNGHLLACALVGATGTGSQIPQSQDNYLAVLKLTPGGGVDWSVAAHTGNAQGSAGGLSKAIRGDFGSDGIPGTFDAGEGDGTLDATPIGRIAKASEVFANTTTGPSISSPALDRAGNLYFFATVALNAAAGTEYQTALIRGNRNSSTGGYELELLLKLGDVIAGVNSERNYQIQHLGVADADSGDSGSIFSSSIVQDTLGDVDLPSLADGSPRTLGALHFRAKIVYDVNNDGLFIDPSATSGSTSPDQAHNVLMVMMPRVIPTDFNQSGNVDLADLLDFFDLWSINNGGTGPSPYPDFDGNGTVDLADLLDFFDLWSIYNGT